MIADRPPNLPVWRRAWERWKALAKILGDFQARVILGLLYFVLVGPVAVVRRLVSDPLGLRRSPHPTHWIRRPDGDASLDAARKQ